jgi:hypothetical protein
VHVIEIFEFTRRQLLSGVATIAVSPRLTGRDRGHAIYEGFFQPVGSSRPLLWWHWLAGNVTANGIIADLSWMARIGAGGVHMFDAAFNTPQVVAPRVTFGSPKWRGEIQRTSRLAGRLDLEFGVASSPGYSLTGGPWVSPQGAMKKLIWSETRIEGGRPLRVQIPQPSSVAGPFGNLRARNVELDGPLPQPPHYYEDAALVAYPGPSVDEILNVRAQATSSAGRFEPGKLFDDDLTRGVTLPYLPDGRPSSITLSFAEPTIVRAVSLLIQRPPIDEFLLDEGPKGRIEISTNGVDFEAIANVPAKGCQHQTLAFNARRVRAVRLSLEQDKRIRRSELTNADFTQHSHRVMRFRLHGAPRIDRAEDKAGFSPLGSFPDLQELGDGLSPSPAEIIDLSGSMNADGCLEWDAPPGHWTLLRIGCSLTGKYNAPASREATGLEADKLDARHVRDHLLNYWKTFNGPSGAASSQPRMTSLMVDSYEAGGIETGAQNWTSQIIPKFASLRGYDMRPWLPVLTGRLVGDRKKSERFLWDFRQTLADLLCSEHYGEIGRFAQARRLTYYAEAHEHHRAFVGDGMDIKAHADVPTGAIWAAKLLGFSEAIHEADLRESASVAHIHGKRFVAAEAFTAFGNPYSYAPSDLKPIADRAMAFGVNRFLIHTSVHQPLDAPGPGLGLGIYGQWFTRHESWAEQAKPWMDYLARSSHLLSCGSPVVDIAWLYGEGTNLTHLFGELGPNVPKGYAFDYVSPAALLECFGCEHGRLITKGGMRYQTLVVDPSCSLMSVTVLEKLAALAKEGARICGTRPISSPSLADDPERFRELVDELWGRESAKVGSNDQAAIIAAIGLPPDLEAVSASGKPIAVRFVHRKTASEDVYFVQQDFGEGGPISIWFRVRSGQVELWHADSGAREPLERTSDGSRTCVKTQFAQTDSRFFIIKRAAGRETRNTPPRMEQTEELTGPWTIRFPTSPERSLTTARLESWSLNQDSDIRYFSGTATYSYEVELASAGRGRTILDLGDVHDLAQVFVNDKDLGLLWKRPFCTDVTDAIKPGLNKIQINVTNLWRNRLIGDKQPRNKVRHAWASYDPFSASDSLLPSGLLGPVKLSRSDAQGFGFCSTSVAGLL